jgi:hypothetical protein
MAAVAAPAPLTAALDPAKPQSLVSLALGDLPVEIIGSPALRRLTLVKTLRGKDGLETEVQQFHNESGIGIRSIPAAIREFNVPEDEASVLQALSRTASFDIASRRLALLPEFRNDPRRRRLLEQSAALRFDRATQQATEALTARYTRALFADVFAGEREGMRSIGQLVARLNAVAAAGDPAERRRAQAHVRDLQQRFRLNNIGELLCFFGDFELLVTAIGYYRQNFLDLAPHMRRLDMDVRALPAADNPLISAMLAMVSDHLHQTMTWIERFFSAFDASFDDILSSAEPQTFKQLQEKLQSTYRTIGARLCAWGLRLQALHASSQRRRRPVGSLAQIDLIREVICKHLDRRDLDSHEIDEAIHFLRKASGR